MSGRAPDGLAAFADPLGPVGRARARVASAAGAVILLALLVIVVRRLDAKGQLDADDWNQILSSDGLELLGRGLLATLKAAASAVALSLGIGVVMALGRLSSNPVLRWVAGTYIELFRALPSLLLIVFCFFGLPELGIPMGKYSALVLGLSLYNSAVMAEIVRAGILSLPRGQTEAAQALGMRPGLVTRLVVLPQAVSRMLPSLIAQSVVVLKDTSYGFVIAYEELLRVGSTAGEVTGDVLQAYVIVAVLYIAVCLALSQLARWVEGRQRRRYGRAAGSAAHV